MGADEEKMDHPSVDRPNRVRALDSNSNTFVAPMATDSRHYRQSLGFASMRNRSKDDYCDVVVGRRLGSYSAAPLQRCQSDMKVTMRPQKAINRNGTIARNQFRGIRRDVLESQTQHIIRSMTVSILAKFNRRNQIDESEIFDSQIINYITASDSSDAFYLIFCCTAANASRDSCACVFR